MTRMTQPELTSLIKDIRNILDSCQSTFPDYFNESGELKEKYIDDTSNKIANHIKTITISCHDMLTFSSYSC